ncbi:MAG: hypothetical protein RIT27_695 [Pseudomonadota bacterium]|jgi:hypothetical protein
MTEEKAPPLPKKKLPVFLSVLFAFIIVSAIIFDKLQQRFLTIETPQKLPSFPEKKVEKNSPEQKIELPKSPPVSHNQIPPKETKKSTLTWSAFAERLKTVEQKRQEVFKVIEQNLPQSTKQNDPIFFEESTLEDVVEDVSDNEEKKRGENMIEHWKNLNERQKQFVVIEK